MAISTKSRVMSPALLYTTKLDALASTADFSASKTFGSRMTGTVKSMNFTKPKGMKKLKMKRSPSGVKDSFQASGQSFGASTAFSASVKVKSYKIPLR